MNHLLTTLQPYPFEKLRALFSQCTPNANFSPISLGIGEPKHDTPAFIQQALQENTQGLAQYPTTLGSEALRQTIASWLINRYQLTNLNPATEILPVNGSREALFAFAQTVLDPREGGYVISPNPFYQIYEGAALLGGAQPYFINCTSSSNFLPNYDDVPQHVWQKTKLLFVCSPGNPTGAVLDLAGWQKLFTLADQYGFIIASDECYSEIYINTPPLGGLEAATKLGRDWKNLVIFSSLSKRSNVPGLRSGFVAGDAAILKQFLLYRTYHGSAMSPSVQAASIAAWKDEHHVEENRRLYREKFSQILPTLQTKFEVSAPDASFYLWVKTPIDDIKFAQKAYADTNLTVLPGSLLSRDSQGINPGKNYIRLALVAQLTECLEATKRLIDCASSI